MAVRLFRVGIPKPANPIVLFDFPLSIGTKIVPIYGSIFLVFMVYGTSNRPQHDIGNYLGPCGTLNP